MELGLHPGAGARHKAAGKTAANKSIDFGNSGNAWGGAEALQAL